MKNSNPVFQQITTDKKNILGISLLLLLAVTFTLRYIIYTYYPASVLETESPGLWLSLLNSALLTAIVLLNKNIIGWTWKQMGMGKPVRWWQPALTAAISFVVLVAFSFYLIPLIIQTFGPHQNITHFETLSQNLPKLISVLMLVWITSAFLEELIFRAYLINTLDLLLGNNFLSAAMAVGLSALIFGLTHAYQGISGILITTCIGLIFGVAFLLNGRRIWPLIFVHGIVDSITLLNFYNS
jgi:membrane protease YdiL (CAAX protease family)